MNPDADVAALRNEFTNALTEVLAENAASPPDVAEFRGHMLLSKDILNTMNIHFAWL